MTETVRRVIAYDNLNDFLEYATKLEIKAYITDLRSYNSPSSAHFFLDNGTEINIGTKID